MEMRDRKILRALKRERAGGILARPTVAFRNKAKYNRKLKHKNKETE